MDHKVCNEIETLKIRRKTRQARSEVNHMTVSRVERSQGSTETLLYKVRFPPSRSRVFDKFSQKMTIRSPSASLPLGGVTFSLFRRQRHTTMSDPPYFHVVGGHQVHLKQSELDHILATSRESWNSMIAAPPGPIEPPTARQQETERALFDAASSARGRNTYYGRVYHYQLFVQASQTFCLLKLESYPRAY